MNGRPAEREQGSSSSRGGASNLTVRRDKCKEAPSDGMVDGHVPFSVKRRRHIINERQRRVHMNTLMESLQELLPADRNPRKDRCSLLEDVVAYLQSLEEKAQKLTRYKESIINSLAPTKENTNKTLEFSTLALPLGSVCLESLHVKKLKTRRHDSQLEETIITFTSLRKKGILSQVLLLLNMNKFEIINATFTTTLDQKMLHFIHAQVPIGLNFQSDDLKTLFSSLTSGLETEIPSLGSPKGLNFQSDDLKALFSSLTSDLEPESPSLGSPKGLNFQSDDLKALFSSLTSGLESEISSLGSPSK